MRVALARAVGKVNPVEREVDRAERDARPPVDVEGDAVPDRGRTVREQVLDDAVDRAQHLGLVPVGRRDLDRAADRAVARNESGEDLRPAEVDPDNTLFTHVAATITARMPEQEKPYRVYKGGRAKGKVPLQRPTRRSEQEDSGRGAQPSAPGRRHVGRWITLSLLLVLVLAVVWLVASYISVSGGIKDANGRVPAPVAAELKSQDGLLSSTPTTILVLGTDGGSQPGRGDAHRSDSMMLIRTDPSKHRLAFLSIPRDLRVEIPGHGRAKINAASQLGGPALALKTVKDLTGLDVNHIAFVNFDRFRELIDSVGGIDVVVPKPILSNRFDCPYATSARCRQWEGWRFEKGAQHMNGQRALVYSRIRENRLDPSETDLDRARRQQQVIQATAGKVTSFGTALKLPFNGGSIVKPLATDLSAGQVIQLGWAYFRADKSTRSTAASVASPAARTASRSSSAPRTTSPRSRCSRGARPRCRRRRGFPTRRAASSATASCEPAAQSAAAAFLSPEPESFVVASFFSLESLFSPEPPPSPSFDAPLRDPRP